MRQELARFRGREVDTAGDGFFATFDGPARGVRCALAIRDAVHTLGIDVRAGLHTGECELVGPKVGGIAVHMARASWGWPRRGRYWCRGRSATSSRARACVRAIAARTRSKGVPDDWRLFVVQEGGSRSTAGSLSP